MVKTIAHLAVVESEEGIDILYVTHDEEYSYSGYFSDYASRAFQEVKLPECIWAIARSYETLHQDESFEICCRPTLRLNIDLFEIEHTVDGEIL